MENGSFEPNAVFYHMSINTINDNKPVRIKMVSDPYDGRVVAKPVFKPSHGSSGR